MLRFSRTKLLLGEERFSRLTDCHIAIIGLGAVGGYALEGLARAGVGRLTLADFDTISPSNINRQILALESTIGKSKAVTARKRVLDINPQCRVEALEIFADEKSITPIIAEKPDAVIDAIDSLNPKVQVLTSLYRSGIKTFSSMGAALRLDPSHIKVSDISKTRQCPLARRLRKRLRGNDINSGITCVYSTEPVEFEYQPPPADRPGDNLLEDRGRDRRTLGSLPTLTAMFGLVLANEVIHYICLPKP